MGHVIEMTDFELITQITDARIAAIRFDLLPMKMVLDLDAHLPESRLVKRVWFVFGRIHHVTLELRNAIVPNGLYSISGIYRTERGSNAFRIPYTFLSTSNAIPVAGDFEVCADDFKCFESVASHVQGEYNMLSYEDRVTLASDEDLLSRARGLIG